MKIILYTQRVEEVTAYQETRDSADRRLPELLDACGFLPMAVPNQLKLAQVYIDEMKVGGVFLTGGNSPVYYGGISPERDAVDAFFISQAVEKGIPVLGICRGMQSILDYFHVPLQPIQGHVAVVHDIQLNGRKRQVNSYHTLAARAETVKEPLRVIGISKDGVAEAVEHERLPIQGIMWHPEREHPFREADIAMVRSLFGGIG